MIKVTTGKGLLQSADLDVDDALIPFLPGEIPTSICPENPGKIPKVATQKRTWRRCYEVAAKAGTNCGGREKKKKTSLSKMASGTASARRGLRAQRIGEADRPGPWSSRRNPFQGVSSPPDSIRVTCYNISSASKHFNGNKPPEPGPEVIVLQETKFGPPAYANTCRRCFTFKLQILRSYSATLSSILSWNKTQRMSVTWKRITMRS